MFQQTQGRSRERLTNFQASHLSQIFRMEAASSACRSYRDVPSFVPSGSWLGSVHSSERSSLRLNPRPSTHDSDNSCDSRGFAHPGSVCRTFLRLVRDNDGPESSLSPHFAPADYRKSRPSCRQARKTRLPPRPSPASCLTPRNRNRCLLALPGDLECLQAYCGSNSILTTESIPIRLGKSRDSQVFAWASERSMHHKKRFKNNTIGPFGITLPDISEDYQ